jgi:hypothetical protein
MVLRSADFYCRYVNNLKCTLALYLYSNGKKGKQANSKRDRERECASVGALQKEGSWHLSVIKLTVRKNPVTSFWDKLERITIFWETILMEKWDRKDT